jgi:glycosyltransferase involved in cell wall biosynthesis
MLRFIKKERKAISHIMMFHVSSYSVFLLLYIKIRHPHIKVYIKMDTNEDGAINLAKHRFSMLNIGIACADLVSCETKRAAEIFQGIPHLSKIVYIPNAIDDELYLKEKSYHTAQKNIIITVARLFSYQKNTDLLLDIIAGLNLKDWKVRLIGPLESEECNGAGRAASFFMRYPHLRGDVEFVGAINDAEALKDSMREAKVFLFTSRYESFGIALLEAAAAGNYIIATDVGSARQITKDGELGFICPESRRNHQNESAIKAAAAEHLQAIIDGTVDIEGKLSMRRDYIFTHYTMRAIVTKPCFKEFFNT